MSPSRAALLQAQAPEITPEPVYTVGNTNVIFWRPIEHPRLAGYLIEKSASPSFDTVERRPAGPNESQTTFDTLAPGPRWYRMQAWYVFPIDSIHADSIFSDWSEAESSIQDQSFPARSCDLSVSGEWSTLDTFSFIYSVDDPAGIDSVILYRRTDSTKDWNVVDSFQLAGADIAYSDTVLYSASMDLKGDSLYQFFIGARDDAKAPDWFEGDPRSLGNFIEADGNQAMCEIKIDTRPPISDFDDSIEDDSLRTSLEFDIPYWAKDSIIGNPDSSFFSGLDTIYLYWGVDSSVFSPTTPIENIDLNEVVLQTPGGAYEAIGSYHFVAPFDTSIYYFYTVAVDVARNRQIVKPWDTTRVFTGIQATLTLFDLEDREDSDYTGGCEVGAVIEFNVPVVDSFAVFTDSAFVDSCTLVKSDTGPVGPDTVQCEFADCSDGEKFLYAMIWVAESSVIASASIVLDTQDPVLTDLILFDLTSLDQDYTDDSLIGVDYRAVELPFNELQYLVLSEDQGFSVADTIDEHPAPSERHFTLSSDIERKTVYGYLIDRAENVSNTLSESIMLFEYAHNYPNPFNPDDGSTNLVFTLNSGEKAVTILIYDLFGNLVLQREAEGIVGLNDGADNVALQWNGENMQGQPVASGGYICVIKTDSREISRHKIAVIR